MGWLEYLGTVYDVGCIYQYIRLVLTCLPGLTVFAPERFGPNMLVPPLDPITCRRPGGRGGPSHSTPANRPIYRSSSGAKLSFGQPIRLAGCPG
ncbi:MAG: hypothetical protein H6633_26465 [Anaerolineales bacterium]|nr:hypothetical protein [Anaerolineales bacterium]